jgi:hypothetical protein
MRGVWTVVIALSLPGFPAAAQQHPDISGYWELRYDSMNVPRAVLTPMATASADAQRQHDLEAIRWCNNVGMPFLMADRAPLDIRQSPTVIAMVAKIQSSTRYIYTDGRSHPAKEDLDSTTNGHSVGHWDGGTVAVDTVGFNDRGIAVLPGGGVRTPDSHLVESYRLMDGGQRLSVTFTWNDAKVFAKPHTYEFRYYKIPRISEPRMLGCDANDAERARFLTGDAEKK